jgi:hypothetical protein
LSNSTNCDVRLANNWPISRVKDRLGRQAKGEIIEFLRQRHQERFFGPIQYLTSLPNKRGYGFAIMALCSLLIETIQCYRDGLPSTNLDELKRMKIPTAERKNGKNAFRDFFLLPPNQKLFPGVDGNEFYANIRNGLLHQAQTKNGWKIDRRRPVLCDQHAKVIDRDKFSNALKESFDQYLTELGGNDWTHDIWKKARRKIDFLVKMSL